MQRAQLAIGVLIGCTVFAPGKTWAAEAAAPAPKARQVTLHLKQTPLKKALEQVFTPGGPKVVLEADVPPLPLNLTLKDVEEDVAFRLVMRQAKKQFPELDFAPTDDGYRIFVAAAAQKEAKANPYPVTPIPKVLAPPSPDFPVVQNREAEPLFAGLLDRAQNGEPLLSPPDAGGGLGVGVSSAGGSGLVDPGMLGYGYDPYGGYGYNGYTNPYSYQQDRYNLRRELSNMDLSTTGLDPNSPAYRYLSREARRGRAYQPGADLSPILGGYATRRSGPNISDDKKKRPAPYFYQHSPQWIMEPRTKFWTRQPSRPGKGNPGPPSNPNQTTGGGYLPGGLFIGR